MPAVFIFCNPLAQFDFAMVVSRQAFKPVQYAIAQSRIQAWRHKGGK